MKLSFDSIEELLDFAKRITGVQSHTATEVVGAPAKATATRSRAAAAPKNVAATVDATPTNETVNPFAGMNAAAPVKEELAQVNRGGIITVATEFINSRKELLPIAKISELMNTLYFIPRGIPQCKVSDLNDFQLADFHDELQKSIIPAVDREIANAKAGASLV